MKYYVSKILVVFIAIFILITGLSAQSWADNRHRFIRDTEIETVIARYSTPIFEAAGLRPQNINLFLIDSPVINAFVAGGSNIFLYTGLILETDTPLELTSVIAHETGHITGGHLVRMQNSLEDAQFQSIIGLILGGLVAAGTGQAEGGIAASQAAQSLLERQLLSYSRVHENAADQASFDFLQSSGLSIEGAASFFEKLRAQEGRASSFSNEYTRTHPLTKDRVAAARVKAEAVKQDNPGLGDMSQFQQIHDRMKAKIFAYSYPKQASFMYASDSATDRYARAIAAYRNNDQQNFMTLINGLIEEEPDNPYFYELKGQALFEAGRVDEALPALKKAADILPNAPLILTLYAHALIESGAQDNVQQAVGHLQRALKLEPANGFRYRLLGLAHGRLGQQNLARLYQAEYAFLMRDFELFERLIAQLEGSFDRGSVQWLRYQDLVQLQQRIDDEKLRGGQRR